MCKIYGFGRSSTNSGSKTGLNYVKKQVDFKVFLLDKKAHLRL